jgi:hypothetical protein
VSSMWLGVDPSTDTTKDVYLKKIELCTQKMLTTLSSVVNITGGDLYGHLISANIFTMIMNKIFHMNSRNYEESCYTLIWICEPSRANRIFYILGEFGLVTKSDHIRPIYLNQKKCLQELESSPIENYERKEKQAPST